MTMHTNGDLANAIGFQKGYQSSTDIAPGKDIGHEAN